MPAKQRGQVYKRGAKWAARYYDEEGKRPSRGGFATKSEGWEWVNPKVAEVEALRRGERVAASDIPTVSEWVDTYVATHEVDPATRDKLRYQLAHPKKAFGEKRLDQLRTPELQTWRSTLPALSRHQLFSAFRTVLEEAVTSRYLLSNPTDRIKNHQVKLDEDREIKPFPDWAEVEAIAAELCAPYRALPLFLVGTGMRPEEALALRWSDIDNGVASIEWVYSQRRLKPCKKSHRQRRRVPLRAKVLEILAQHPRRIDSPLVFPARRKEAGYLDLGTFRNRHWTPALRAAGIEHRGPYACRHTFASWSIAAGMSLFYLSKVMGTSVIQLDRTYGHLIPSSDAYLRGLMDDYDAGLDQTAEGLGT